MGIMPKIIFKVKTKEKVIALTFDDGPHPFYTPQIIDILAIKNIKATFFVTGENIEANKKLTTRMIAEGHELGNHSYYHKNLIFKNSKYIKEEILRTDRILRKIGYKGDIHFRPPFGRILFTAALVLASLNKNIIMWNVPTKDYKEKDKNTILNRINKRIKPGAIIVLHDSGIIRTGKLINRQATVDTVNVLIDNLHQQGYKFKKISELINY